MHMQKWSYPDFRLRIMGGTCLALTVVDSDSKAYNGEAHWWINRPADFKAALSDHSDHKKSLEVG